METSDLVWTKGLLVKHETIAAFIIYWYSAVQLRLIFHLVCCLGSLFGYTYEF